MQSTVPSEARAPRWTVRDFGLGALAGVIGGLAMGLVGMIVAALNGFTPWTPLIEIAGVFSPSLAGDQSFRIGPILLGTLVHFALSAALGLVFAGVYRGLFNMPSSWFFPLCYGFIFGIIVWFISTTVLAGEPISGRESTPSFIVQHLVFGAVTGVAYGWLRPARAYLPRY